MFEDDIYSKYIMSILGYQNSPNNICGNNTNNCNYNQNMFNLENMENNIDDYYPEIYKVVYPMVHSACNNNNNSLSIETIEKITNDIYIAIEGGEGSATINIKSENMKATKLEVNQIQKSTYLKELIKILVIRELKQRNNNSSENRYYGKNSYQSLPRMQKNNNFYKDIPYFDIYENI